MCPCLRVLVKKKLRPRLSLAFLFFGQALSKIGSVMDYRGRKICPLGQPKRNSSDFEVQALVSSEQGLSEIFAEETI